MIKKILPYIFLTCILLAGSDSFARVFDMNKKTLKAFRIQTAPKIDGILNDKAWNDAIIARDFVQMEPYNGQPSSQKTEVKLMYDDNAIYIGAMLYDTAPDSIFSEFSKRDDMGVSDNFGIHIDPYNDALNAYGFFVNPAGVQRDVKVAEQRFRDDRSWDAVWESQTLRVDNGWVVEIKIPYSALRFPKKDIQDWGINFFREIKRYREVSTWNFIDKEINGVKTQAGNLEGLENISPPLRLSAVPYLSGSLEKHPANDGLTKSYGYGMDIKVGLNESFTLDMTLIPDFSQVQSDDKVVNLSPFETFYQERRPFFTEGTELFNRKDRIFYSRRVGKKPINYGDVYDHYEDDQVISNPENTQLINATKISGKTEKGLGIGIFNAMTSNAYANVEDEFGNQEQFLTQAFSNYSMLVIDQSLKNNSFVALYNTNVYRGKDEYMANVTGAEVKFVDKKNMYSVSGHFHLSQKYYPDEDNIFGHSYRFSLGKISGKFKYSYAQSAMSNTYDHNDLGYLRRNNNFNHRLNFSYNEYNPFWKLMNMYNSISFEYSSLYEPRQYSSFSINMRSRATTKNFTWITFGAKIQPKGEDDHFESRVEGWVYKKLPFRNFSLSVSPDYRKKFVTDFRFAYTGTTESGRNSLTLRIGERIRFSKQFNLRASSEFKKDNKSHGYVTDSLNLNDDQIIIFGRRDIKTITNTLESNFIFNNTSSLSLRLRHYWIRAIYNNFYDLKFDGTLEENQYIADHDFNVNVFNIDLVYTWNFAPGSELLLVYKNLINADVDYSVNDYLGNLKQTLNSSSIHNFSIKLLYYIDYQSLKKKKR